MKKIGELIFKTEFTEQEIQKLEDSFKKQFQLKTVKIEKKRPEHKGDDTFIVSTDDDCFLDFSYDKYSKTIKAGKIGTYDDDMNPDPYGATRTFSEFFSFDLITSSK